MTRTFKVLFLFFGLAAFIFVRPASAQTPINCGEVSAGSISAVGEKDSYTFGASANDSVTIRAAATSGNMDAYLELYGPDGAKLAGADEVIDKKLTAAGTYTIIVRDSYNDETGNYALTWQKLNSPCSTNLACGQTTTGIIGNTATEPPWQFYYFDAQANDKVTVRAYTASGNMDAYLELYGPDGTRLGYGSNLIDKTLTLTGKYTIVVTDSYNDETGSYCVAWIRLNNSCAPNIACGQAVTGSITTTERLKFYKFTASANDSVTIRAAATSGNMDAYLELYGPDGAKLAGADEVIDKKLTAAGTYTIIVRDSYNDETGNYALTWQRLNNPCSVTEISYGTITTATLGNFVEMDAYKFTASAGSNITICSSVQSETSGDFSVYLELYDTSGTRLDYGSSSIQHTFATGGTFYLFITDSYRDGTGTYRFILLSGTVSCFSIDLENPRVALTKPKDAEIVESGTDYNITWSSSDNVGVISQEILLSTDSGVTYPTVIASSLAGNIQSYAWPIPQDLTTPQARIKITAQDARGNIGEGVNKNDFIIINTSLPTNSLEVNYEYDKLQRFKKSTSSAGTSTEYTYDALGNRLKAIFK